MKLKKLTLGESMRILSNPELKHLKGGAIYYFCHCKNNSGAGVEVENCGEACNELCGGIENVNNCNHVKIPD